MKSKTLKNALRSFYEMNDQSQGETNLTVLSRCAHAIRGGGSDPGSCATFYCTTVCNCNGGVSYSPPLCSIDVSFK